VSAAALAVLLGLMRQRVGVLADDKVFERLLDGKFDIDAWRVAYIRFQRRERRQLPRT
jgi:hypothetical protein